MSLNISSIFLMSVLVLGLASYPSALPNLGQDITNSQLTLGNVAFAQEEFKVELKEEIGISDVGETEEEIEEEEEIKLELKEEIGISDVGETEEEIEEEEEIKLEGTVQTGSITVDGTDGSFTLEVGEDTFTILTDENTEFEGFNDLTDIDGLEVEVEAVPSNDDLLATEIELEEENGEEGEKGPPGDKTEICHIPPGNPLKAHTITIGEPAVNKHLAHGDVIGTCDGQAFSTAKGEIYMGEKQSEREARLAEKEARLADKQAEREARLAEKQMEFEARLAEKESQALQRADDLIKKLEQRITDLELRLQTLLNKVETGEYFGTVPEIDPVLHTYSISIDGTASSLFDESVTTDVSGEIFIENLVTTSKVSKFKVTGGEIFVGDNIYDVVFGKARISSTGPSGEKDSMILILQAIDSEGNGNTIRLSLDFDSELEGDFGTEPIEVQIIKNSKISGQWSLSASGELFLLQA